MALPAAGYAGTPLANKLGLKAGQAVAFLNLPAELAALAEAEPFGRCDRDLATAPYDLVHAFHLQATALAADLDRLRGAIRPAGAIWISWPKKAAKVPTDITEDVVRALALERGLVDVKVCAVSEVWSGLKLVIPVKDRPVG